MGALRVLVQGQTLILTAATNASGVAPTLYSDAGLSSGVTLPLTMSADTTLYGRDGLLNLTVTHPDGTVVFTGSVQLGSNLQTIAPVPTVAQLAAVASKVPASISSAVATQATADQSTYATGLASFKPRFWKEFPTAPTMFTEFAAGHGWTTNGGALVDLNNTEDPRFGFQCVKVSNPGSTIAVEKGSGANFDATGKALVVWMKIVNPVASPLITFIWSDATFANYYQWQPGPPSVNPQGWHPYILSLADTQAVGGSPTPTTMTRIKISFAANQAGDTIYIGGVGTIPYPTATYPNGVVTFSFDDALGSIYTQARAKLDQYSYGANAYLIADRIGLNGYPTMTNLRDLEEFNGWEMSGHASTLERHVDFTTLDSVTLDAELYAMKRWLQENRFRGADHLAYPFGSANDATMQVTRKYFSTARSLSPHLMGTPHTDPLGLLCYAFGTTGQTVAQIEAAVDKAYTAGKWLMLCFHDITAAASSGGTISATDFATIVDYVHTKGMPVKTVSEVIGWS